MTCSKHMGHLNEQMMWKDTFLKKKKTIEMNFDLETKSMYTFKEIEYYWMNNKKNCEQKIPSFLQVLSPFYYLSKFVYGEI